MTLFPDMMNAILSESIIGRARENGLIEIDCHNIRDYTRDKHKRVDDTPYGGGKGMLLMAPPVCECFYGITAGRPKKPHTVYLSPKGALFTQQKAKQLLAHGEVVLLCGHYEGIDQRAIDAIVDEEISIGDYVLTGGELPAAVLVDAVCRMVDGVLADKECYERESLSDGLLEYPQYTRPFVYNGAEVPQVLLSGHHANIEQWRLEQALKITREKRPDLLRKIEIDKSGNFLYNTEKDGAGGVKNEE